MSFIKDFVHYLNLKWFKFKYKNTKIISEYFSDIGAGFYSQKGQDSFIYSEFFKLIDAEKIPKVIIDVGCNHPEKFSNSYFFEKKLGYKCIAVDPLLNYAGLWKQLRPDAVICSVALGSSNSKMKLLTLDDDEPVKHHSKDMFSTLTIENAKNRLGNWKELEVQVVRSQELLDSLSISEIGIISIDVEGFEIEVLKGIDFSRTKIHIAIIENNSKSKFGSHEIRDLMFKNGFVFYARIWGLDDVFINENVCLLG